MFPGLLDPLEPCSCQEQQRYGIDQCRRQAFEDFQEASFFGAQPNHLPSQWLNYMTFWLLLMWMLGAVLWDDSPAFLAFSMASVTPDRAMDDTYKYVLYYSAGGDGEIGQIRQLPGTHPPAGGDVASSPYSNRLFQDVCNAVEYLHAPSRWHVPTKPARFQQSTGSCLSLLIILNPSLPTQNDEELFSVIDTWPCSELT